MNRQEVIEGLTRKLDANRAEVKRQLEFIAELPGHSVHANNAVEGALPREVDLLQQLSATWKEGQALSELARELVPLIYPEPPAPVPVQDQPS